MQILWPFRETARECEREREEVAELWGALNTTAESILVPEIQEETDAAA